MYSSAMQAMSNFAEFSSSFFCQRSTNEFEYRRRPEATIFFRSNGNRPIGFPLPSTIPKIAWMDLTLCSDFTKRLNEVRSAPLHTCLINSTLRPSFSIRAGLSFAFSSTLLSSQRVDSYSPPKDLPLTQAGSIGKRRSHGNDSSHVSNSD